MPKSSMVESLATGPDKIVDAKKLDGRVEILQSSGEDASGKAANSGDKNFHAQIAILYPDFIKYGPRIFSTFLMDARLRNAESARQSMIKTARRLWCFYSGYSSDRMQEPFRRQGH